MTIAAGVTKMIRKVFMRGNNIIDRLAADPLVTERCDRCVAKATVFISRRTFTAERINEQYCMQHKPPTYRV